MLALKLFLVVYSQNNNNMFARRDDLYYIPTLAQ
ncbi:hypothetical protein C354_04658 [Cryptococcus neoformans MW-RSA1955]|nr:hypothetical protein C354_04658 [Cryptococcus neoformans var. grubii MW-RSA1955]